VDLVDSC